MFLITVSFSTALLFFNNLILNKNRTPAPTKSPYQVVLALLPQDEEHQSLLAGHEQIPRHGATRHGDRMLWQGDLDDFHLSPAPHGRPVQQVAQQADPHTRLLLCLGGWEWVEDRQRDRQWVLCPLSVPIPISAQLLRLQIWKCSKIALGDMAKFFYFYIRYSRKSSRKLSINICEVNWMLFNFSST